MTKEENSIYLRDVFANMRKSQKFPEKWKETDIKWIFKKGNQLNIKNYRPIALSNALSCFVRILTGRLERFLESSDLVMSNRVSDQIDRAFELY